MSRDTALFVSTGSSQPVGRVTADVRQTTAEKLETIPTRMTVEKENYEHFSTSSKHIIEVLQKQFL